MTFIKMDPDCQEAGLVSHAPLLGAIPQNEVKQTMPGLKELKMLRAKFDTTDYYGLRNYTIFSLILGTGMRNGEIRALKVDDLHFDNGMLNVPPEGKTGSRLIPIDSSLVGILKAWLRRRSKASGHACSWLFPGLGGEPLKETGIVQIFTKLQPGVSREQRITAHTLRHVFATYYLSKNGSIERLRLIMGHKSYDTLRIYLQMSKVDSAEAKEELERVSPLKTVNSSR
jgi:integrase